MSCQRKRLLQLGESVSQPPVGFALSTTRQRGTCLLNVVQRGNAGI
ncbi:hypothetical protein LINPERHAP1_LOCUS22217 [Linum perenne]